MYQSTTAFGDVIQQDSRTFHARLVVDSKTTITDGIKSIVIKGGSNSGESFIIGSCVSQYIEVELYKPPVPIESHEIELSIGILVNTAIEYIPMGVFTAERPEADEGSIKFSAFDRMMLTERAFFSGLPENTTTIAVLNEMSAFLGIDIITSGLVNYDMKRPDGYICREVLSYISQMYAGFAICNRRGQIEIKRYSPIQYTVESNRYWDSFIHNDFPYDFLRIVCYTGKDADGNSISIGAGTGTREMAISNPFMTQERLNGVYETLKGFSYMPGSLKFMGDPRLDAWDIISVKGTDGTTYKVPIMMISQEFDGGLTTEIKATGESEVESDQGFKGPMAQSIDRYSVQLALVNHAIINKLDAEYAEITFAKIKDLEVINGKFENLDAIYAKIENLTATNGKIDNLEANYANIENLLAGNAGVGDLVNIHLTTQNAVIDNALIKNAVINSISVNDLLAGKIFTNKFEIWSDESGGMKIVGATQQWLDKNNIVRMQAGLDSGGVFNYYILDASGNIMFDALNGVRADGIKTPVIVDGMVADNANIQGKKIDIQSLVTQVNESNVQINSSKIIMDAGGQNLQIAFDSMQEEINGISVSEGGLILQTYVEGSVKDSVETSVIHARVYSKNRDVTQEYGPEHFVWTRSSEEAEEDLAWNNQQIIGYSLELRGDETNFEAEYSCNFYLWEEAPLLDFLGNDILALDGTPIVGLK